MAQDLILCLADPELWQSAACDYAEEIETAVERCYECDDEYVCEKHADLWRSRQSDLEALAMSMLVVATSSSED